MRLGPQGWVPFMPERLNNAWADSRKLELFTRARDYDEQTKTANYETTSVYGFGHPLYYVNVIKTLKGEATPETDGREGLTSRAGGKEYGQ